jgi:hypothetical protein
MKGMEIGIEKSPNGWIFWTRDIRAPGQFGGGGTSTTFCETEEEARELVRRFDTAVIDPASTVFDGT